MRYVFLALIMFGSLTQAATITAEADRSTVHLNESFKLVFKATGSVDEDPDFSPLETYFDILNRSRSSNISIINGDFQKSTQWSLTLMPKQAGSITIPSIDFGEDKSPQLRMTVKEASAPGGSNTDGMSLEMETSSDQAWVQGQLLVTVKLLSNRNIARYGINELQIEGIDARIEQLGDDKQYRAQRGGETYLVLERNYAVFPQQSGRLRITPLLAEVELASGRSQLFDPFNRRGQVRRLRAGGRDVEVRGIPSDYSATHWLPAREIQLIEEWPDSQDGKPEFRVGEPVTRTLSLLADGLTSAQLPRLPASPIDGIKHYPDQPTLHDNKKPDGIIGIREERVAMIPTRPGSYTLPPVEVSWWNIQSGQVETARIPAREIQVRPATETAAPPSAADTLGAPPPPEETDAAPGMETIDPTPATPESGVPAYWRWLALALGAAWLLTLAAWALAQWRRRQRIISGPDNRVKLGQALKTLTGACRAGDADACSQALLTWGRTYYQDPTLSNLGELGRRAGEPLKSAIEPLESTLYSNRPVAWDGPAMADICRQMTQQQTPSAGIQQDELEPLYK